MYRSTANATKERHDDFDFHYISLAWIIAVLLVSILGNTLVIAAFFRDPRLKVIFNLFVVHLAAADIILSFIVILAVVDGLTQISLLGTWTLVCQLCAICANAIPVEQLILVHIMCHDRHKALQRGMSYTRNSFHWHIEKLVLFLTWVITLVGSFLMTDLMSSVKLFGYSSCKFPGRLLYMSYTSFLHLAMLVSLTVAVMCIAWDFRKHRKRQQFERLCVELEDDSPFLLSCKASASSQQSKQSLQNLIPRSPVQVFRSSLSLPSPGLHRPTCLPKNDLSAVLEVCEDVLKPNGRLAQIPYLKDPSPVDELPACSYAEIPPEGLRFNLYGIQGAGNHGELSVAVVEEDLRNVGGQYKDDQHKRAGKDMMWELYDDKFQHKPAVYSIETAWLHAGGCPYDTDHELGQEPELCGTKDQCVEKVWPLHAESQCRDLGGASSVKTIAVKDKPTARIPVVNIGKYEHCKENQEQGVLESSEGTDERVFAESMEDLLPASLSISDDELADIPQPHLRPRTDSLYTLRSCLSVSEESLSKTLDELMDVSSQSEASASNEMSEVLFKPRKEKQNENRLCTTGDEEEEQSEVKTICDMKSSSDVSSRTFPINTLPGNIPAALIHCQGGASSDLGGASSELGGASIELANLSRKGSFFSPVPKLIGENENADTEKHHSTSKDLSTAEHAEVCPSSDILPVATATEGNSSVLKELSVMLLVESELKCSLDSADNNVDTQLQSPSDENTTRNKVDQQLPEHTPQVEMQLETLHPHELDNSEEEQDSLKNNNNDNEDSNNSAGNRKPCDKNITSRNQGRQENSISHTRACPVSVDNVSFPVALINSPEMTAETVLSAKTRQLTKAKCTKIKSLTADCMERHTSEEKHHVNVRGGKIKYKYESVSRDNISYVHAKSRKDSKFYIGSVTYDMNYFGIFSASSNEYVDVGHSQRDIELAVESWLKFYDINPAGQFRRCECEIARGRKLLEKCSNSQQCKNFIPQPGHSVTCNSLVRARQIWLDFYGIEMVEKNVPGKVSQQPNGHLLSVPVEVHAAGDDSCDGYVMGEQAGEHLEWKRLKHDVPFDPAQVDEVKVGKRLKRVIKYNERASSGCEDPAVLGGSVCATELEKIPEDFKQNSDTADNQQENAERESLCKFVSGDEGNGSNTAEPGEVTIDKESFHILQTSNFVNQASVEDELPTLQSHGQKMICEGLEDTSDVSIERPLSLQYTEETSNPEIDCIQAISFPKRQAVHCAEEASFLESTSQPPGGKTSVFSCVFPLENGAGAFECYSKELDDQIKENPRVDYISGKEFVVDSLAKDQIGFEEIDELKKSSQQGEISLSNICSKHEDQMRLTEQADRKDLIDISRNSDGKNGIYLLDRAFAQGKNPEETDYHFVKSKPKDSYEQETEVGITSGTAADIAEAAVTTYQILESLSITCRALLAELGIYQDILEGAIPLDKEMIHQKEMKWMTPCPDCERRQQEKLQKVSGAVPGSAQRSAVSSGGGCGARQNGDTSGNAMTDAQANNSSGLHHLTIDELRMEHRSALESEVSSLNMDMFHDLEEADMTRTSASASRAEFFMRMVRSLPDMMRAMSRRCSIEELKGRDPELCILLSLVCIVMLQLICWLPIVTLYMVYDVTEFPPTPSCTELVFLWLWCSRMAVQPILYAVYSKYFYQNYIELILCRQCR